MHFEPSDSHPKPVEPTKQDVLTYLDSLKHPGKDVKSFSGVSLPSSPFQANFPPHGQELEFPLASFREIEFEGVTPLSLSVAKFRREQFATVLLSLFNIDSSQLSSVLRAAVRSGFTAPFTWDRCVQELKEGGFSGVVEFVSTLSNDKKGSGVERNRICLLIENLPFQFILEENADNSEGGLLFRVEWSSYRKGYSVKDLQGHMISILEDIELSLDNFTKLPSFVKFTDYDKAVVQVGISKTAALILKIMYEGEKKEPSLEKRYLLAPESITLELESIEEKELHEVMTDIGSSLEYPAIVELAQKDFFGFAVSVLRGETDWTSQSVKEFICSLDQKIELSWSREAYTMLDDDDDDVFDLDGENNQDLDGRVGSVCETDLYFNSNEKETEEQPDASVSSVPELSLDLGVIEIETANQQGDRITLRLGLSEDIDFGDEDELDYLETSDARLVLEILLHERIPNAPLELQNYFHRYTTLLAQLGIDEVDFPKELMANNLSSITETPFSRIRQVGSHWISFLSQREE